MNVVFLSRMLSGRGTRIDRHGRRRPSWRIALVVFSFPVLCFLAALAFAAETALFLARSELTTGTVVERYEWVGQTPFDRGVVNYEPVFSYIRPDGEVMRASVGSAHSSFALKVGDSAPIHFDPASRGNVRMATWQGLWFVPAMLALIGAVALVPAALVWLGLYWWVGRWPVA